jgi:hypothetical protein
MAEEIKRLSDKQVLALELATAKSLNIDVKNIKFFSGHDGMQGINADLYVKGKKFASGYDDARGGGMDVRPSDYEIPTIATFKDIEDKLRALPKYIHVHTEDRNGKKIGGKPFEYESQVDLASIVDAISQQKEELKEDKKGIRYTMKDGDYVAHWNMSLPSMIKKYPKTAIPTIQKRYDELSSQYPIKNKEYLSTIGVQVNQLM